MDSLNKFGLNPFEWDLVKAKCSEYLIVNKKDRNFCFRGVTQTKSSKRWQAIQLVSL